jgi:periplasmic protein CpxP/Spy
MKNNALKYIVVVALLANAATLIFFWYNRPERMGNANIGPKKILEETLNFDATQEGIFQTLKEQHHASHDSLLGIIADKRQLLYRQKGGANDSILNQIGTLNQEIERITYNHFSDVRKICTPTQQVQLDSLLEKTVQQILLPKNKKRPPPEHR